MAVLAVPVQAQEEYLLIASLQAPVPQAWACFGLSVSVSGNIIVVGEDHATVDGKGQAGRAHIFDSRGNWKKTIAAPAPEESAQFGFSVSVSGGVIVVGEPYADVGGEISTGRAHIFDSDGNWKKTINAPTPQKGACFGFSVSVGGNTIVVGEYGADVGGTMDAGRAHIYDSDGNWKKTLSATTPKAFGQFGFSVAASGNTIAVGEREGDVGAVSLAGNAYIFDSDGNWKKTINSPAPKASARFGHSVGGNTIVVGEPWADVGGTVWAGKAHIFDSDGNWKVAVNAPTPQKEGGFGKSVAVSGDTVVVGEPDADVEGIDRVGRAYVFDSDGHLRQTLGSPMPPAEAYFGCSVSVSGSVIVVGEYYRDVGGTLGAGRAYIFVKLGPVGGFLMPVDKLRLLAPYLTLLGLVATVSAVAIWKRRKT